MEMKAGTKTLAGRLLGYAWLCALAGALIFSALSTDRRARQVEEYPCCCDPFGYLQMAQDIRQAAALGQRPRFTIESAHSRLLIELMQSRNVPLPLWQHMVGPLAYHYFPKSDQVGVRYPPGTGLMLALFPQDKALHGLDRLVIAIFLAGGLVMLVVAAVKRAWLSAGLFILALDLGLEVLGKIDNASFSINAVLAPLLLSGWCLFAAFGLRSDSRKLFFRAWFLTFVAGLLFGFAILVRLPVILLMPGVLVLLWPSLRHWPGSALVSFILGVLIGGILPLSIHQNRVAGAWYLPTYPSDDTSVPALKYFWLNLSHYFGTGRAGTDILILLVMAIGCAALLFWFGRQAASGTATTFLPRVTGKRLIAAALLILGLSLGYFLTHQNANFYYLAPATFATALLLALGVFGVEGQTRANSEGRGGPSRAAQLIVLALACAPGLIAIQRAWANYERPAIERKAPRFVLPAELADERAWIWADELSGTLWYYARKPAHKLSATDKETRARVYEFVLSRGEPQYIVGDDPNMKFVEAEILQIGGRLELRGEIDGKAYYLIHWPADSSLGKIGGR